MHTLCCNPFLGPHKKIKIKINKQPKKVGKITEGISAQKMIEKLVKEVKKYIDWIFNSIFLKDESPVEKENLNF